MMPDVRGGGAQKIRPYSLAPLPHWFTPRRYPHLSASGSCGNPEKQTSMLVALSSRFLCTQYLSWFGSRSVRNAMSRKAFRMRVSAPFRMPRSAASLGNHAAIPQQARSLPNYFATHPNSKIEYQFSTIDRLGDPDPYMASGRMKPPCMWISPGCSRNSPDYPNPADARPRSAGSTPITAA